MRNHAGRPIAILGALIGLVSLPGCAEKVPAPKSFASYTSKDGRFACDYPRGWKVDGGGNTDFTWAKFTRGSAEIRIEGDLAGSLIGDIARSTGGMMGGDLSGEDAPVARAHDHGLRRLKGEDSGYEERAPKTFDSGMGEGRRSVFITKQTLGGKIFGYRATLLGGDRRITVTCRCPATNWQVLKPAFEKVITSVKSGGR
jgi:hypothetical protein